MHVGIGLPVSDPVAPLAWALRAEHGPFTTVALLDRIVYDNPEPLVALAAIAGATRRVRVQTEVLLAPLHRTTLLAKQAATLDRISAGRFTLGIGIGGRVDDYVATGVDVRTRGRRLDEQMARLRGIWVGDDIGPAPARPGGPEVLFGGFAPAVVERVARWGDGFLGAALPPRMMATKFEDVRTAWRRHDRAGEPRLVAQVNVALGPELVIEEARAELRRYYGTSNPHLDHIVNGLLTTPAMVKGAIAAYGDAGADEVMLYCWASDIEQIDRMAEAV